MEVLFSIHGQGDAGQQQKEWNGEAGGLIQEKSQVHIQNCFTAGEPDIVTGDVNHHHSQHGTNPRKVQRKIPPVFFHHPSSFLFALMRHFLKSCRE